MIDMDEIPTCEQCDVAMSPRTHGGGKPKLFCSENCKKRWWRINSHQRLLKGQRRWQAANRERLHGHERRFPEKKKARNDVNNAVAAGRLTRGPCEVGVDCEGRIEAHHDDYSKPLEVRWLCSRHHGEVGVGSAC